MTDQELIQLLQEKSAGELTPAEIDAIRARWTQSPALRQALVEHLHLETQLTGALGPVHLDVDTILQRATDEKRSKRLSGIRWAWLIGLCLLVAAGIGITLQFSKPKPADQLAENTPKVDPQQDPTANTVEPHMEPVAPGTANAVAANDAQGPSASDNQAEPTTKPVEKPNVPLIAHDEAWASLVSREIAPWAADNPKQTADFKVAGHDEFPDSEARRWLAPVDGHPFVWSTDSVSNPVRRIARFNGLAKLKAPWTEDAVLRLTPFEVTDLTLYFWHGPTGVALRFYTRREPHTWAAFEISRENSSPKPTRWGLLTTDSGSYTRSTPGTLDIRQQKERLVLARGGIVLMSVPFTGHPIEVYVEGQFRLRGLSMHRSVPFVDGPDSHRPVVIAGKAAKLPWAMSAESPVDFSMHEDGSVSLTVDSREKMGTVCLPFGWLLAMQQSPRATGLFEAIVQVESADPGTGIFLGDRDGRPAQQVGFFRDAATQQITFGTLRPGENRVESNYNPNDMPPPYLAKTGWLKLVAGLGTFQILTSGDGRHWGYVQENPSRDLPGAVGSIGLFGLHGPSARTIRVRQIQVRELTGVTGLADENLRQRISPFSREQMRSLSAWRHHVVETQPADIDLPTWMTNSAIVALSQGPSRDLSVELLRQLITVTMASDRSFEQKHQVLDDACLLCDLHDDWQARFISGCYEELGWQLAKAGDQQPLKQLRPVWLRSPIWAVNKMRNVWERLSSHEIVQAIYQRDWQAAWLLSQSASYWNLMPNPDQRPAERGEDLDRHARWAKALAAEFVPALDDGSAGVMPPGLRHPLNPLLNKEAYNVRAELQSALSGHSYEDACRILMTIAPNDGPGLLPDVEERELFVSMPTAIASARRAYPGFVDTLSEKFEPLGMIRIRSAMNRQDVAGLQAATLQFMGTNAARDAHAWLGDMALSIGQFGSAEQHYRDALVGANVQQQSVLTHKLNLSRALGGQIPAGALTSGAVPLPTEPIDLNGNAISPDDFKSILQDLGTRSAASDLLTETLASLSIPFPASACRLEPRAQFDGQPGNNPGRWEFRFGDPFGRQLAAVADDKRIYVSNRFQVNAYSVTNGQQAWAQGLGSEQGESYALPMTPMRPLLAGDRLFVRRLTKAGPEMACLGTEDGRVIWHQRPSVGVLTDPVVWNGRLFALILTKLDEDLAQVEAAWFDPTTGSTTATRPLFRLREAPDRQFTGQLTLGDRIAVCAVAGSVASFDLQGDMRWLRREILMQKPIDELAEDFRVGAPIIQGDRVIVAMPGVREVRCLDLETGRTRWERPLSQLRGLLHATESRIIADTVGPLVALNSQTGEVAWSNPLETRLEATAVDRSTLVLSHRINLPNHRSKPGLSWLDIETGAERAQTLIQSNEREEFQLGPLFSAGGKWWSFVGQTWKEPKRELQELIFVPGPTPASFQNELLQAWAPISGENGATLGETELVVPGWFPVANYRERLVFHGSGMRGEPAAILIAKIDGNHEFQFISRVSVVASRKTTLRVRVGNQQGQKWKLSVTTGTRVLLTQDIEDAGSQDGWRDLTADLSPLAGQQIPVRLILSSVNNTGADALLKGVQVLVE